MYKIKVDSVVSDYGVFENRELKLILNIRKNAEMIAEILKLDNENINCTCIEKNYKDCKNEL